MLRYCFTIVCGFLLLCVILAQEKDITLVIPDHIEFGQFFNVTWVVNEPQPSPIMIIMALNITGGVQYNLSSELDISGTGASVQILPGTPEAYSGQYVLLAVNRSTITIGSSPPFTVWRKPGESLSPVVTTNSQTSSRIKLIGGVVAGLILAALILGCVIFTRRRNRRLSKSLSSKEFIPVPMVDNSYRSYPQSKRERLEYERAEAERERERLRLDLENRHRSAETVALRDSYIRETEADSQRLMRQIDLISARIRALESQQGELGNPYRATPPPDYATSYAGSRQHMI